MCVHFYMCVCMRHLDVLHNVVPDYDLIDGIVGRLILRSHVDEDQLGIPVE